MTSQLAETFNLSSVETSKVEEKVINDYSDLISQSTLDNIDKIDAALPAIKDLTASDKEFDDIADMATASYKELMDLGINVEVRFGAEIFNSASSMLGHALTAKKNKVEKKLKTIELQLKKMRLDQQAKELELKEKSLRGTNLNDPITVDGEVTEVSISRNDLLDRLLGKGPQ